MRYLCLLLTTVLAFNAYSLTTDTKSELKKLYFQINSSEDPYKDDEVADEVTRLVDKSCYESAVKALNRKQNLSEIKVSKAKVMMRQTCSCVANSNDMIKGVIQSAMLFKQHGKHSTEAKSAMRNGMSIAKKKCFKQMRANMLKNR